MQLLLIRHGIAVERGTPGVPDDERPLTPEGEKKFQKAARGLASAVPAPDLILTSPLPRAQRTAEIAATAWGLGAPTAIPALATGSIPDLAKVLAKYPKTAAIALVGHEPYLSDLLANLLGAEDPERLAFRKGGVALVDLPGAFEDGGVLVFAMPPRLLRSLRED